MLTSISKLHRTGLLTATGLFQLIAAVLTTGVNLMAMLRVAGKLHPQRIAVVDDREQISYAELWRQSELLAMALHRDFGIKSGQKVAIACRNHVAAIKAIFAGSRLGAHVFLLNCDMSGDQMLALFERLQCDFYIYDDQLAPLFSSPLLSQKSLPAYHATEKSVDRLSISTTSIKTRLPKVKTGNIVVMTGGTTGLPKAASRKPAIFSFLPPFLALLAQVHLDRYRSVYIATPIYHGFGLASLFMGVILGTTMYVTDRFQAERCCDLVARNSIEAVTLVPLMLQRMLQWDVKSLSSLQCIVTGGALLSPMLARETGERLGPRLFNMYGTSEAGFCIMAVPAALAKKPDSIGQPVWGVQARVVDDQDRVLGTGMIGRLCIRSSWTTSRQSWVETGDLAYRDVDGDLFLCGRVDDMIVSGGENVYPIELENILLQHPEIDEVGVVGIADAEFGQRLKAVIKKKLNTPLDRSTLLEWLKPRVARYQMPAVIEFRDELPYTAIGKLNKKLLAND